MGIAQAKKATVRCCMLPGWATPFQSADIVGNIQKIIPAKGSPTALLFFIDGVTWKQRQSDLRKIVACQNNGDITRIYTYAMAAQFEADLAQFKKEAGL